jgi:hypothetical protein
MFKFRKTARPQPRFRESLFFSENVPQEDHSGGGGNSDDNDQDYDENDSYSKEHGGDDQDFFYHSEEGDQDHDPVDRRNDDPEYNPNAADLWTNTSPQRSTALPAPLPPRGPYEKVPSHMARVPHKRDSHCLVAGAIGLLAVMSITLICLFLWPRDLADPTVTVSNVESSSLEVNQYILYYYYFMRLGALAFVVVYAVAVFSVSKCPNVSLFFCIFAGLIFIIFGLLFANMASETANRILDRITAIMPFPDNPLFCVNGSTFALVKVPPNDNCTMYEKQTFCEAFEAIYCEAFQNAQTIFLCPAGSSECNNFFDSIFANYIVPGITVLVFCPVLFGLYFIIRYLSPLKKWCDGGCNENPHRS